MRFPLASARSWPMAARNSARLRLGVALVGAAFLFAPGAAGAADCPVSHEQLLKALKASVKPAGGPKNGGFENHEWAGVVARDGTVCAVAFSGGKPDEQWPGSRAIAMVKASTANAFSV